MKKVYDECVGCEAGRGCIGSACKYRNVTRYYCDYCGEETLLYKYDSEEICSDCLLGLFDVVEGSDL